LALDRLRTRGFAETSLDLAAVMRRALEVWRAKPEVLIGLPKPEPTRPALFMGESGILLVLWRLEPSEETADDLHALVLENLSNPANEVMWGAPGTLLAARLMHGWTGEARWGEAARRTEAAVLDARGDDGLWSNVLHAGSYRGLGPFHGAAGNVLVLGLEDLGDVLREHAVVEGGLVNWPTVVGDDELLLQWCAGAPGIVTCAASYLDEDLLLGAAELAWKAGPSGDEKGSSLCHGTAGTGWTFLKAFERTQDELWLARARRFAVHALEQVEGMPSRYSLWTGDPGVALFAADCLEAQTRYPVFEAWDER
jgi:lanthionine synthetase-like protein